MLLFLTLPSLALAFTAVGDATSLSDASHSWPVVYSHDRFQEAICAPDAVRSSNLSLVADAPWSPWTHVGPCKQADDQIFCLFSSFSFNNRGISIVTTPERALALAKKPAFEHLRNPEPAPLTDWVDPLDDPRFEAVALPGKGIGMVATRHIQAGELIMATTPSLLIDDAASNVFRADLVLAKTFLVPGLDNIRPEHRAVYLDLAATGETDSYEGKVNEIVWTNAYNVDTDDEFEDLLYGVFTEVSRINHACRPNCEYHIDPDRLTHIVHASRDILPGEELSVTYMSPMKSRNERLTRLRTKWGFSCDCKLCTSEAHVWRESDSRLVQIKQIRDKLADKEPTSSGSPDMADLLISLYKQERMWGWVYIGYYHAAVEWNGLGKVWKAVEFARLAYDEGLFSVGPRDWRVKSMKRLVDDPTGHWSWAFRLKPSEDE